MRVIPYGRQHISQEDIDAVVSVLKSDWLTQGPAVTQFEQALSGYCGAHFGVAVSNATAALHIACKALEVGPGDYVWTSPNTFLASANCALFCGASIDFVDICPRTYNMSTEMLATKLEIAKKQGKLPKIVIPVHFAGQSCDMKAMKDLSVRYDFKIIEDASHAVGGYYQGKPIGSCQYSDITIFSFHPVKIMTTAEGGLALTNDASLAEKMQLLRSHGMTRDPALMTKASEGAWYYQQVELGFNYRITDLQCALGLSQFKHLDEFVKRRHVLAKRYDALLKDLPVTLPSQNPESYSAFHLYVIQVKDRKKTFNHLKAAGIGVNVHYIPVHLQPYYQQFGFQAGDFPVAEAYYERAITLPLYFDLSEAEQDYVVLQLKEALNG